MKISAFVLSIAMACVLLASVLASTPDASQNQPKQAFRIGGVIEKPGFWTIERLAKDLAADIKTVSYTLKGEKGEAKCVPLLSLVKAAKPQIDPKIKNHELAFAIIVRADDGYTAAFSMGELMPAVGKREVWLALDRNGAPLAEKEGSVQLIVPEDDKPSRWVHGVTSITVVDGAKLGK